MIACPKTSRRQLQSIYTYKALENDDFVLSFKSDIMTVSNGSTYNYMMYAVMQSAHSKLLTKVN